MPFPIIPIGVGLMTAAAAWVTFGRENDEPKMTPQRQKVFDAAIRSLKDPDGLEQLGNAFMREGLNAEGQLLLKRAALRRMTPEERARNRAEFKRGMASTDPKEVLSLAETFDERGATGSALELRRYARGLLARS